MISNEQYRKLAVVVYILWMRQNLVISHFCNFAKDGKEMYKLVMQVHNFCFAH